MLRESDDFFLERGPVHKTLRTLAESLERESISYAVLGGMALYLLGYRRFTSDVDLLLTPGGLQSFRDRLVGRGYAIAFPGARRTFRDQRTGVKIDVITTGEYPGDEKPKAEELGLPSDLAEKLDPSVRSEYQRLWELAQRRREGPHERE